MNLGSLLSGAGAVSEGMREAEEAERRAQQNQLAIMRQNREERALLEAQRVRQSQLAGLRAPASPTGISEPLPIEQVAPLAAPQIGAGGAGGTAPTVLAAPEEVTYESVRAGLKPGGGPSYRGGPAARKRRERETAARVIAAGVGATVPEILSRTVSRTGSDFPDTLTARDIAAVPTERLTQQMWDRLPVGEKVRRIEEIKRTRGTTPTAATAAAPSLFDAMQQVESANRPDAVSPKGAVGLMQVMPATAANPGFGLPNVFDFAQQNGVPVTSRTEAEAARLLRNPAIGRGYGELYMNAMLNRYNGDTATALVAYNAGPQFTDQWLAAGADPNRLPTETRNYVPKVMGLMTGSTTTAAAAPVAPANTPIPAPGRVTANAAPGMEGPSVIYMNEPPRITEDTQRLLATREQKRRMAEIYARAATPAYEERYNQTIGEIEQIDNALRYMQGMQAIESFKLTGDPRMLAAIRSRGSGQNVQYQPRSDGTYNLLIDGKVRQRGMSADQMYTDARLSFDDAYRQSLAAREKYIFEQSFESRMRMGEEDRKLIGRLQEAIVKGEYDTAVELMKKEDPQGKLTVDAANQVAYLQKNGVVYLISLADIGEEIEGPLGGTIRLTPTATPITIGQ